MSGKTINIDLNLFNVANTKKRKPPSDKPIKMKAPPKPKSNKTQRNDLLKRIREHQEKQYQKLFGGSNDESNITTIPSINTDNIRVDTSDINIPESVSTNNTEHNDNFKESVQYLEEISKNSTPESTHSTPINKTSRNYSSIMDELNKPVLTVSDFDSKPIIHTINNNVGPSYGCLKGGNLPTYRNWKQTMKIRPDTPINVSQNTFPNISPSAPINTAPSENRNAVVGAMKSRDEMIALQKVKDKIREEKKKKSETATKMIKKKQKRILKRTYHVGKNANKRDIGVLLSNKTMRNHITTHTYALKQKPIQEIKKYLVKKGFIKAGSTAPNDVLRKIYESIMLIGGEVTNHNSDNLLHNFFTGEI